MSLLTWRFIFSLSGISVLVCIAPQVHSLTLANEPLFIATPIKPNVMLVVDDSGSMDSEVLMPTNDGALWWNTATKSFVGLDASDNASPGTINYNKTGKANSTWKKYVYLFPNGTGKGNRIYGDSSNAHFAVPPSPEFAFTRSPEYNKAYYDYTKTYTPWPSSYGIVFSDADPQNAPSDPVRGSGTLDLTQDQTNSSSNWTFKLQPGMRDAAGNVVSSTQDETFTYYPATFYTAISGDIAYDGSRNCNSPDPSDYTAFVANPSIVPAGVDAIGPDGKCLVKYEIKPGHTFPSGRSYSEEIQNFANWFTYSRKRHLAMRGGIMNAFDDVSGIRTGLFSFNHRPSSVSILDFDTQKSDFFNTLKNLVGSGGTPTRQALKHAGDQYKRTDGSAPITAACQKNFTIVFTDGFAVPASLGIGNQDGGEGAPYADPYSETLGDIAMKYYRDNLRTDLPAGKVPVPSACYVPSPDPLLDCNKNLHMVTFGVGLGVKGNIYGVTHNTRADAFSTPPAWQEPNLSRNPVQVDDLYHATLNGRGELLNASTPDEITTQMKSVMKTIIEETSSGASAATNSTSLASNSVVYQARFNSGDWSGQLLSKDIDLLGNISPTPNWDAGDVIDTQPPASRQIITISRDSHDGIPFRWTNLSGLTDTTQADFLNQDASGTADGRGSDRVDFLRGADVTGFRTRSSKLGDIVHSTPFYVGAPKAGFIDSSYAAFASTYANRDPIIYVGANDGMLHGFDAATGEEKIAYVPGPVYKNLSRLTDPGYGSSVSHHYFVDGSPMVADAQLAGNWKTVLAGGLNGGGQGYYALDITDPAGFSEANAASLVLWEFTDEDDPDLGYTYNQPPVDLDGTHQSIQIAKLNNGKWALIVGNGYNSTEADGHASTTGHAVLFILFLEGGLDGSWTYGTDYIKIDTGVGSVSTPNGLATPTLADADGDGDFDLAYAGDLQGNLWKFDLTDSNPANWGVAKDGGTPKPLFTAKDAGGNPQPITTAPMVVYHPQGGYMVGFGTGKYLEHADLTDTSVQTLYGIWDDQPDGGVTAVTGGRSKLVEQTVLTEITVSGKELRLSSNNEVTYSRNSSGSVSASSKRGWFMDLPTSGERVAYNPIPRDRRFVFVTLIPDSSDPCAAGGSGWLMELDYLDGSRLSQPPFDITGDNKINDSDKVAYDEDGDGTNENLPPSGMKTNGIPTTPAVMEMEKDKDTEIKLISKSTGALDTVLESKSSCSRRCSWREIIGN